MFVAADAEFQPHAATGPQNVSGITSDSSPLDFLNLFWTDELWNLLVTATNRQASKIAAAKP